MKKKWRGTNTVTKMRVSRLSSAHARSLSAAIQVPDHLKLVSQQLTLPMASGRCMIIGQPSFKYPIAVIPPPPEVAPLLAAIRSCDVRPFRIISYVEESGRAFNCAPP